MYTHQQLVIYDREIAQNTQSKSLKYYSFVPQRPVRVTENLQEHEQSRAYCAGRTADADSYAYQSNPLHQ